MSSATGGCSSAFSLPPFQHATLGYPALSAFMARDSSMLIFKRFGRLSTRSLLLQQAELLHLEDQLHQSARLDAAMGKGFDINAKLLLQAGEDGKDDEQFQLLIRIRTKLREYHDTLLQHAQVARLAAPREYDAQELRKWLMRTTGGNIFLKGIECFPWKPAYADDLVSLKQRNFDGFTSWLAEVVLPWAAEHKLLRKLPEAGYEEMGLMHWQEAPFNTLARVLSVIISTLIPSVSIIILYFIKSMIGRIVTAMALSLVFSTTVAVITSAQPVEIFASTAAFAAVQVVFIGSTST